MSASLLEQLKGLYEVGEQLYRDPDEDLWREANAHLGGLRFEADKMFDLLMNKDFEPARAKAVRLLAAALILNHSLGNDLEKALAVVVEDNSNLYDRTREEVDKTIAVIKASLGGSVAYFDPQTLGRVNMDVTDGMFIVEEMEIGESTYFSTNFRKAEKAPLIPLISHKYTGTPILNFPADEYVFREMVLRMQIVNSDEGKELVTTSALRIHSALEDEGFEIVKERELNKLEKRLNGMLANADCRALSRTELEKVLNKRLSEEDMEDLTTDQSEAMYLERISQRMVEGTTAYIEDAARQQGVRLEKVEAQTEENDPTV